MGIINKVKPIGLCLILCPSLLLSQLDGDIISRQAVIYPAYDQSPSVEMYYDKATYETSIKDEEVMIEKILYYSDGLKAVAYLSNPASPHETKYPVIIFNRGSAIRNDISDVYTPLFKKFVHQGFIVIAPALKGSEGGEGKDQVGGDDINDIMNILHLLDNLVNVDASNLFMLGESRGAL